MFKKKPTLDEVLYKLQKTGLGLTDYSKIPDKEGALLQSKLTLFKSNSVEFVKKLIPMWAVTIYILKNLFRVQNVF
ncbi:hypothetical protein GCM10011414_18570 [Croceivirga lutea]|nr:hypothetical protein GCM10011414_18570 [Croceivirga lutea]